jgi:hypothetical protein
MIIRGHGMLLFTIYVSLLVQALQRGVTKLKVRQKNDEIIFFQDPLNT